MSATPARMTAVMSGVEDGIAWVVCRAPIYDAANGYAQIPEGHPWSGLEYDDIDVRIHGGLTFSNDGWIGFDTLHMGDYWPGMPYGLDASAIQWDDAMVAEEAKRLARLIAEAV